MPASILDGRLCADLIKQHIKQATENRKALGKTIPGLAVLLVGDDPASHSYVTHKQRACEEVGFISKRYTFPNDTDEQALFETIETLNRDPAIHGILLQLPLPAHLPVSHFQEKISPEKDVDGFHPYNLGRLAEDRPALRPCTPYGVIQLLEFYNIPIRGQHAVLLGASQIVGRPMALELLRQNATVTICHEETGDLRPHVKMADILISATGKIGVINPDWLQPGVIVVDVGFNRLPDGKITGDIDFERACQKASWITPVPGGVGQMTVATLLQNTLKACEQQE